MCLGDTGALKRLCGTGTLVKFLAELLCLIASRFLGERTRFSKNGFDALLLVPALARFWHLAGGKWEQECN